MITFLQSKDLPGFSGQVLVLLFAQKAEVEFHENVREKDKTGKS